VDDTRRLIIERDEQGRIVRVEGWQSARDVLTGERLHRRPRARDWVRGVVDAAREAWRLATRGE
jgi:hypothetical protein